MHYFWIGCGFEMLISGILGIIQELQKMKIRNKIVKIAEQGNLIFSLFWKLLWQKNCNNVVDQIFKCYDTSICKKKI